MSHFHDPNLAYVLYSLGELISVFMDCYVWSIEEKERKKLLYKLSFSSPSCGIVVFGHVNNSLTVIQLHLITTFWWLSKPSRVKPSWMDQTQYTVHGHASCHPTMTMLNFAAVMILSQIQTLLMMHDRVYSYT